MMRFIQQTYIYILHQTYEYHLSHAADQQMIVEKTNFFSFCEINATKFGSKHQILHSIIYHYMTSYSYIIMNTVDSCTIWLPFDSIMQLKKSYYIAINVGSRKSAATY